MTDTIAEEWFIDFHPDVPRVPELNHMQGMNGPYPSREALVAAWGEPDTWNPPLVLMKRTVTTTPLEYTA